jgi:hypothetical protein
MSLRMIPSEGFRDAEYTGSSAERTEGDFLSGYFSVNSKSNDRAGKRVEADERREEREVSSAARKLELKDGG